MLVCYQRNRNLSCWHLSLLIVIESIAGYVVLGLLIILTLVTCLSLINNNLSRSHIRTQTSKSIVFGMMIKSTDKVLNLKQFLRRQQVLTLYRTILRTTRKVSDKDNQHYLYEWARKEFRDQRHLTDPYTIQSQIKYGEALLNELQQSLDLSK